MPGAFLIEPEMFSARIDEKESKALATRRLAAIRRARRVVTFQATVLDLAPGTVFTITGHPRMDLDKRRLLAVRTPKSLPEQKTQSTWKSESTPGGGGWNEITFEDEKGRELVYMRAERDLERLVRQDESVTIGGSIETQIGASESRTVTADQTLAVGGSRSSHVEVNETISVGSSYRLALGDGSTGVAITSDKRIVLTTGEASIVLDGPNIYFDGQASVRLSAGELVSLAGGEVHVDGKPNVYLNSTSAAPPGVLDLDQAMSGLASSLSLPFTPEEEQLTQLLATPVELPGEAPDAIVLPAYIEEQLKAAREKIEHGLEQIEGAVKDRIALVEETIKGKLDELEENLVPRVEAARAEAYALINALRGKLEKVKAEAAARIAELKARAEQSRAAVEAKIQEVRDTVAEVKARARAVVDGIKQRIKEVRTQARAVIDGIKQRIADTKAQAKAIFDDLRKRAIAVRDKVKSEIDAVKGAIESARDQVKQTVGQVKDAIEQTKQTIKDTVTDAKTAFKETKQEVKDLFKSTRTEAKELFNSTKAEVKDAVKDAKDAFHATKSEIKAEAREIKQEVKDLFKAAKDAVQQTKDAFKIPVHASQRAAGQQAPAGLSSLLGGVDSLTMPVTPPAPRSAIVTRAGGFGGEGIASAVNGNTGATFLQSPSEGQLMVMRTQASLPLSPAEMSARVVDHQMNGLSAGDAFAGALRDHGYVLYERPCDSELGGEFLKKAVL